MLNSSTVERVQIKSPTTITSLEVDTSTSGSCPRWRWICRYVRSTSIHFFPLSSNCRHAPRITTLDRALTWPFSKDPRKPKGNRQVIIASLLQKATARSAKNGEEQLKFQTPAQPSFVTQSRMLRLRFAIRSLSISGVPYFIAYFSVIWDLR